MILYGELTKVEPLGDGSIRVHGVASTGGRDSSGEVVSPDAMRAALPGYMAFGAVREMHQAKAAGAALHAEVDEEGSTRIVAHVVDPTAVKKVRAGVYKGLSIGGKVLARDPHDASLITAIRLDEISLVDRPCNPEAVIDLWKAADPRQPTNDEVRAEAERMAKAAGRPGRRNDYVAAARAKLAAGSAPPSPSKGEGRGGGVRAEAEARSAGGGAASSSDDPHTACTHPHPCPSPFEGEGSRAQPNSPSEAADLQKLQDELAALQRRLAEQAAEIARLRAEPLPPRAAASRLAKGIGKGEDGPLSPDAFAEALAALPPGERAHLIMKAALSRPIAL